MNNKKKINSINSINDNNDTNNNINNTSVNNSPLTKIDNIPIKVFDEFEEIRKSGLVNMCLKDVVISLAFEKNLLNLATYCIDVNSKTNSYRVSTSKYCSILKSYSKYNLYRTLRDKEKKEN